MSKIDILAGQLGIKIVPFYKRRKRWETCARQTLRSIAEEHGEGHLSITIKAIKANPHHATELWSETIEAVSDVLAGFPDLPERGGLLLDQFEALDLRTMRLRAKQIAVGDVKPRQALAILLITALAPDLPEIAPVRPAETLQAKRRKQMLHARRATREAA